MLYESMDKLIDSPRYIPLQPYKKIASVKWANDDELIFTGKEYGYGIDTGRSGLIVIDCDVKEDIDGIQSFMDICMENGGIPETFTVETPNNGMHFYFKNTTGEALPSSASTVFGKGVDVRANGGYIVGPGSQVKDTDGIIKTYEADDPDAEIAPAPEWIVNAIKAGNKPLKEKANTSPEPPKNSSEELEQKNALNWAINKMANAATGTRNAVLNHTAYFLGCKRVPELEAQQIIMAAVSSGLSRPEAEKTFQASFQKGLEEEPLTFDAIVKEFNTKTGTSFKDDPLDTEFYTHVSLAYNFWIENKNEILFWETDNKWYFYNDPHGIWEIRDDSAIKLMVKEFLEKLVLKVRSQNSRLPISVYRAQEKLWLKNTIEAVATVSQWEFMVQKKDLFDNNPMLVNCKNGVFNVETNTLEPHNRAHFITKYIPINASLEKTDKYADAIIESIHPDEREYMQLIAGQSLIGEQPVQQACFFLHGSGSNGKSTFIDLMLRTSGSYGKLQPPNIFMPDNGKENYAFSGFESLRTAIVEELPDAKHLNTGALKRLVGTSKINAREIYGKHREFENKSTIFVSCNRLPMVSETDDGTWRRLVIFTFPYSYKKNKADISHENDRLGDPRVLFAASKKVSTAEAFLAWRLRGAVKWANNNKLEYQIPKNISASILEWNENNDLILAWFNEELMPCDNTYTLFSDLFESYNSFLSMRGQSKISMRYFSEVLKTHSVFKKYNLKYFQRTRPGKELGLSRAAGLPTDNPPDRPSFVTGIAFR